MKKLILLLCSVMIAVGVLAQNNGPQKGEAKFAEANWEDVNYWVGADESGNVSSAMMVIHWYNASTNELESYAWGFRWDYNTTMTAMDMLNMIDKADSRLSVEKGSMNQITSISYKEGATDLTSSSSMIFFPNGWMSDVTYDNTEIYDGDIIEFCEESGLVDNEIPSVVPNYVTVPENTGTGFGTDDILYWVGTGSNEAIFTATWCELDGSNVTTLAWGYKWNGEIMVADMMRAIDAADSRLSISIGGGFVSDLAYTDATYTLTSTGDSWMYNVNGAMANMGVEGQTLADGDVVDFCDGSCLNKDSWPWLFPTLNPIAVSDPTPTPTVDPFGFDDVVYWVGNGSKVAILQVVWDNNGSTTSLAWGYKWTGDKTIAQMLTDIDSADNRLAIDGIAAGYITDFAYSDGTLTLNNGTMGLMYQVNGSYPGGVSNTNLVDSAYVEFCDFSAMSGMDFPDIRPTAVTVPVEPAFGFDDVVYWVGNGSKQAILQVVWDNNGNTTSLAWGYKWTGDKTIAQMLTDIDSADNRLAIDGIAAGYITDFAYSDGTLTLNNGTMGIMYQVNGSFPGGVSNTNLVDSAYVEFCDFSAMVDGGFPDIRPTAVTVPVELAFGFDDVVYWVGNGSKQAILQVVWDNNGNTTSLAWGYKWTGDKTIAQMLTDIDSADNRLAIDGIAAGYITDFAYSDGTLTLNNGTMGIMYQVNGDFPGGVSNTNLVDSAYVEFCDFSAMVDGGFPDIRPTAVTVPTPSTPTPEDATIASSEILYWIGEGSNEAIFVMNWATPDSALAWGYKFSEDSITVKSMMDSIAAKDARFSYTGAGAMLSDISFVADEQTTWNVANSMNIMYNVNGEPAGLGFDTQKIGNGNLVKVGDYSAASAVILESFEYAGVSYPSKVAWTKEIAPVPAYVAPEPTVEDATIAASEIKFWIGNGDNKAIFVVNWANPDSALAWGYKFSEDSVIVKDMMDAIVERDPRFSYAADGSMLSDINFVAGENNTWGVAEGQYWMYNVNGKMAGLMFTDQKVGNGDLVKWGDPSAASAVVTDSSEWGGVYYPDQIAWTKEIAAVNAVGPFSGAVGTEGCEAISCENSDIAGWAVSCEIVRGPQQLGENEAEATYGSVADALGAVTMDDNLSVVSLGDGGKATLTFASTIKNGEGPDFAIFENSFDDNFLELAFVEVSSDGENFVRFPATSYTQTETQIGGMGKVDPTMINNLAGKYRAGWGTPFDLEELRDSANLDINHITHVRIIDVVGSIDPELGTKDAFGNMINDPFPTNSYSGGFDLDGVAVLNMNGCESIDEVEVVEMNVYPNPTSGRLVCKTNSEEQIDAVLYDMSGRIVKRAVINGSVVMDLSDLANGVYMLRAGEQTSKIVVRK